MRIVLLEGDDGFTPEQLHATFFGASDEGGVEGCAAKSEAGALEEIAGYVCIRLNESDAFQRDAACVRDADAKFGERGQCFRRHAFTAGLLDGRSVAVGDRDSEASRACGNRGG
jgi:hypothetical protein